MEQGFTNIDIGEHVHDVAMRKIRTRKNIAIFFLEFLISILLINIGISDISIYLPSRYIDVNPCVEQYMRTFDHYIVLT